MFFAVLLFQRCAQINPLTGGQRDRTPPVLLSARPEPLSTNFHGHQILFRFDEFVQVKDLSNQMLITPALKTRPEVFADGKTVKVLIDTTELKPNTTYRFYFGASIADMHEGNTLKNFEYIFSTGDHIDSMQFSGKVVDAGNNAPLNNILVGLYPGKNLSDSLPFKETPEYITHTDASGAFNIGHLPPGTYRTYAISDEDKNLLYDQDNEKIGFLNEDLVLPHDSALEFKLFKQDPPKSYVKKTLTPYYGLLKILFNKRSQALVKAYDPALENNIYIPDHTEPLDTMSLYYREVSDSLRLLVQFRDKKEQDTLLVALPKKSLKKRKFSFITMNTQNQQIPLGVYPRLRFITWMDTLFASDKVLVFEFQKDTSNLRLPCTRRWLNPRELELKADLIGGNAYRIHLDTSMFQDAFGQRNDTCTFRFTQQSAKDLGQLGLILVLNKKQAYLVQLLNEKDQVYREQSFFLPLASSNSKSLVFTGLQPGNYRVRIIFDNNNNAKWDSGQLFKKLQPEAVFLYPKTIKVISDWEIEEEIRFTD